MNEKIILSPLVTEKTMVLAEKKKYAFIVANFANKHQIAESVAKIYDVNPIDVTVSNIKGKFVTFKGRYKGQRKNWKKAIVSLPAKETIKEFALK